MLFRLLTTLALEQTTSVSLAGRFPLGAFGDARCSPFTADRGRAIVATRIRHSDNVRKRVRQTAGATSGSLTLRNLSLIHI